MVAAAVVVDAKQRESVEREVVEAAAGLGVALSG
jgi:hypothetical protein